MNNTVCNAVLAELVGQLREKGTPRNTGVSANALLLPNPPLDIFINSRVLILNPILVFNMENTHCQHHRAQDAAG